MATIPQRHRQTDRRTDDLSWQFGKNRMRAKRTKKLDDGLVETTTSISSCGCLIIRLQLMDDDSTDDYVDNGRYHQDNRQQRVHFDLQTGLL